MGAIKGVAQFDVAKQLNDIIKSYNWDARKKIKEAGQYCAKEMAKELRTSANLVGGFTKHSGKYNRGWSSKPQEGHSGGRYFYSYVVYNKDQYRLTHLLEKGHNVPNNKRGRQRAAAYPHIAQIGRASCRERV